MKMTIGICDDEARIRSELAGYLQPVLTGCRLLEYDSADALLAADAVPDILLLDIQMPGTDGLTAARMLRERERGSEVLIIFMTTFIQYAIDGYDVHAYHFLKKPVDEKRLLQVVNGAVTLTEKKLRSQIVVSGYDRQYRLAVSDILYVETERGHVRLHTASNGEIRCTHSMAQMEQMLHNQDFFRCHTDYLVNMGRIDCLRPNELVLTDGQVLAVSKHRKKELKEALSFYWSGNFI